MDFSKRSIEKELLDDENIPKDALFQNLKELAIINSYLGGFNISVKGVSNLILDSKRSYHIVDIGCGGGDNLIAIAKWAKKINIDATFTGIDMKKEAIEYAKINCSAYANIQFIESDYQIVGFKQAPDIIVSSLFCHHLSSSQLLDCLNWMNKNARVGFIINDLQRNKIAYYSIKWLSQLFSKSYLVKNDAAVSVSRGFKKFEWEELLNLANIKNYTLSWKWAFRYLISVRKIIE